MHAPKTHLFSSTLLLVQSNPQQPANVAAHLALHQGWAAKGQGHGYGLLAFPELSLMGYPVRDLIGRFPHVVNDQLYALATLAQSVGSCALAVGFVEPNTTNQGKPYFNSVAVLQHGRIVGLVRKQLLPTYAEYEDWRQFEAGIGNCAPTTWPQWCAKVGLPVGDLPPTQGALLALPCGDVVGISVCEDAWNAPPPPHEPAPLRQVYTHDPSLALKANGATLLLNLSASVGRRLKHERRLQALRAQTQAHGWPVLYVNQVGGVDECVFDGQSLVMTAQGNVVAQAPAFAEATLLATPELWQSNVPCDVFPSTSTPLGQPGQLTPEQAKAAFTAQTSPQELQRTADSLILGIRDYWHKSGFTRAVLGVSGGIDSAVVVTLLAQALGATNVLACLLPTHLTPDANEADALALIHNLGVQTVRLPIGDACQALWVQVEAVNPALASAWGAPSQNSFAADNVQAMTRATLLRLLGNQYHALPVATSDKSEFYLGYTTVNGDMSGALAPLGDVCKTKVQALANHLNATLGNPIPPSVITRAPGADLAVNPATGKLLTAEEALMPYGFADEVIFRLESMRQAPTTLATTPFWWEERNGTLDPAIKAAWLTKFFARLQNSVFKWWIAPPVLLVDGDGSLAKTDYHHPIVARFLAP